MGGWSREVDAAINELFGSRREWRMQKALISHSLAEYTTHTQSAFMNSRTCSGSDLSIDMDRQLRIHEFLETRYFHFYTVLNYSRIGLLLVFFPWCFRSGLGN